MQIEEIKSSVGCFNVADTIDNRTTYPACTTTHIIEIRTVRWPDDISSPADATAMKLIKHKLELFDKM